VNLHVVASAGNDYRYRWHLELCRWSESGCQTLDPNALYGGYTLLSRPRRSCDETGHAFVSAHAGVAASVGSALYDFATAPPEQRVSVGLGELGGLAGAVGGGWVGAQIGGAAGAFVPPWGAPIGGTLGLIGGSVAGGIFGEDAVRHYYDQMVGPGN
jgi:hypothetical protein